MTASRDRCPSGPAPELLLAYMEGSLEGSERREIEAHVRGCPFCSSELERMSRMHSLLKAHPDVFHPGENELYRLVTLGEDPGGRVAAHLETCAGCRAEVDMLRDLRAREAPKSPMEPSLPEYLARELNRVLPQRSSSGRMWSSMWASLRESIITAFRGPRLVLGTAAAVLVIAVLVIPMWKAFKETPYLNDFRAPVPGVAETGPPIAQSKEDRLPTPVEDEKKVAEAPLPEALVSPQDTAQAKEGALRRGPAPAKTFVVPPGLSSADQPAEGRARGRGVQTGDLRDRMGETSGEVAPLPPEPRREVPKRKQSSRSREEAPEKDRVRQPERTAPTQSSAQEPSGRDKEAEGLRKRLGAAPPLFDAGRPDRESPAEVPGSGKISTKPPVGVTVVIVDAQGRAIPGVRFAPPPELRNRYEFLRASGEGEPAHERPTTPSIEDRGLAFSEPRDSAGGLMVRVRVLESGGLYELNADLISSGVGGVTKNVEAHDVQKDDLERTIASLVSSLLLERAPD